MTTLGAAAFDRKALSLEQQAHTESQMAGLTSLADDLGLDEFSAVPESEAIFAPARGHAPGVSVHRRCYDLEDPVIARHEIRKAASEKGVLAFPDADLKWQESVGLLDLGGGVGGAFPLVTFDGAYIAAYFGFYASGLIRYRRLELTCNEKPLQKIGVPFNAKRASTMPAGAEFEIAGQGCLNATGGAIVGGGVALGPFIAGFAGMSTVSHGLLKEYSITVTGIDGNGKVRVVLRELKDTKLGASVSFSAGIIGPGYDGPSLNADGSLVFMPGSSTAVKAVDHLPNCTSAKIESSILSVNRNILVAAVDLDLNKKEAQEIYQQFLLLCPKNARAAAKKHDSGVELLEIKENQNEISFSNSVNFFGDKVLSHDKVDTQIVGKMVRRDGTDFCYRNSIYDKRFHNFLTGTKSVRWESVRTGNESSKNESRYFHLKYERDNLDFGRSKLSRFLQFAELMGVGWDRFSRTNEVDCNELERLWKKAAHVDANIDLYFSSDGVSRIEKSKKSDAASAFFKAAVFIDATLRGFPVDDSGILTSAVESLLAKYREISSAKHLFGLSYFRERKQMRVNYNALTGRSLEKDVKLFKEAFEFSEAVDRLTNANDPECASDFFTGLGKAKGFKFMKTIAALKLLAGQENTLLGNLSMSGLGHGLAYNGSAEIQGPHEVVYRELTRLPKAL